MDKKIVCAMFITVAVFCMADSLDAAGKARIPKTGETITTYGAGSDGILHKGVAWPNPRSTNNGNGTVTDNLTGLIWLANANCFGAKNWAAALASANGLTSSPIACGLSDGSVAGDWRLPSVTELSSLTDLSNSMPALPAGYGITLFSNVQWDYWSSSTYANNANNAWVVNMSDGSDFPDVKVSNYYVWPVRGGQ